MMDLALSFKESDLLSFGGLVALLPVLAIGLNVFVKLRPERMHLVILVLSYALGLGAKLTIKAAYAGVSWVGMLVALFLTALAACQAFDSASSNLTRTTYVTGLPAGDTSVSSGPPTPPKAS